MSDKDELLQPNAGDDMNDYQEDIDYILDNFDFERVKKAMDAMIWSFEHHDDEVPLEYSDDYDHRYKKIKKEKA